MGKERCEHRHVWLASSSGTPLGQPDGHVHVHGLHQQQEHTGTQLRTMLVDCCGQPKDELATGKQAQLHGLTPAPHASPLKGHRIAPRLALQRCGSPLSPPGSTGSSCTHFRPGQQNSGMARSPRD